MPSYWIYWSIFFFLPPALAILTSAIIVAIAIAAHRIYTPDKLVRLLLPYVKRRGDDNVVFGFVLSIYNIYVLLWVVVEVVFYTMWVFWFNIILIYPNNSNPHAVYSCEVNCFYLSNYSKIELSTAERLTLEEAIKCFAINFNIAGAMSQATGILAFTWILVAILTWMLLNVNQLIHRVTGTRCSRFCYFHYVAIHIVHIIADFAWVAIIIAYNDREWYSFVATPENNLVIAVVLGSASVIGFPIERETDSNIQERNQAEPEENEVQLEPMAADN